MRDSFIFDGKSSLEFGMWVFEKNTQLKPVRSTEVLTIPGMNGNLEIDNGRFNNVPVVYWCLIAHDAEKKDKSFFDYILPKRGYLRLEDSIDKDEFMFARYTGGTEITKSKGMSKWQLEFDCQPQHYLKIGEEPIEITADTQFQNPTHQTALPNIRVYGTGEFQCVSGDERQTLTINENTSYIDFDCALQDAHREAVNCNSMFTGDFPRFNAGNVAVSISGNISRVIITPRWFRL